MLFSIQYIIFTIHKTLQEGTRECQTVLLATVSAFNSNDSNATFSWIPREFFGAAQELLREPWMCCGSLCVEELCTPSRGRQCSQPHVKLKNKKVEFNHLVFSDFLTNSNASLKNIYINQRPTFSFLRERLQSHVIIYDRGFLLLVLK